MGIKDLAKRLTVSVKELDQARLQDRYCGVDRTEIGSTPLREPVRLGGEVTGLRVVPRAGSPSLEVTISDGTGKAVAVFSGRKHLAGLEPGHGVLIEGVARKEGKRTILLNPAYTLLPH